MDPDGSQWILRDPMNLYGSRWVIDLEGSLWIFMDPGGSLWILIGPDGNRWITMDPDGSHRILRDLMNLY